jgi:hypothetical protein
MLHFILFLDILEHYKFTITRGTSVIVSVKTGTITVAVFEIII